MSWHVDVHIYGAYAAGRLDPAAELSVDSHLTACSDCQAAARSQVAATQVDEVWTRVRTTISAPALTLPQRVMRRLGVRPDDAVVVSAADAFLVPWAVAVGFAVVSACVVGLAGLGPTGREAAFLALVPLVPVLAVVASYDALDPVRELVAVTPYSQLRLALLRATAALAVAVPATMAIGLVVPHMEDLALAWLAPSLGLSVAALVLLTWFEAWVTGGLLASAWVTGVALLRTGDHVDALTTPFVQVAFVIGAGVLALALVLRTSTLRLQGGEL
jgi:antitoxin component of MazEF toxin-antitoxin module